MTIDTATETTESAPGDLNEPTRVLEVPLKRTKTVRLAVFVLELKLSMLLQQHRCREALHPLDNASSLRSGIHETSKYFLTIQ
jgi:hypothetical protein